MSDNSLWHRMMQNQILRFLFSSGLGFLVDISAFYLFYKVLFTHKSYAFNGYQLGNYNLSFSISFFLGVVVNFLANKYLVFSDSKLSPVKQFFRFMLVAIVGYFANLGLLNVYIKYFHIYPPIARPAAALSLFVVSFFVHKFFSFNLSVSHHGAKSSYKPSN